MNRVEAMRLIKMTGGFGNQMFIYAFYLRMKKRYPKTRIDLSDMVHYHAHHGYEMNRVFRLPSTEFCINRSLKKVIEFLFFKTILERKQKQDTYWAFEKDYASWPLVYFKGFYQSERYFSDIQDEVRQAFTFDLSCANAQSLAMMKQIDNDTHAVSLHVRRGDYLKPPFWDSIGCVCQEPYYHRATAEMEKRVDAPVYYVFSEDIAWVKEHLNLPQAVYIDWNQGADSWQDMMLMSHCRNHIICNSTFSWWGAWLNPRKNKTVIVPSRWFMKEETPYIYPARWIKVPIN